MDSKFIARVMSGVEAHMSELWLREQFQFHCNRISDIASSKAEYFDVNAKKSALTANRQRVMIWKTTSTYKEHHHRKLLETLCVVNEAHFPLENSAKNPLQVELAAICRRSGNRQL